MAPSTIAVVSGLVVDLIMITNRLPHLGETGPANGYHKALGGKGANAAIGAVIGSRGVRMVGSVGNDEYARPFKDEFEKNGVDAGGIRTVDGMATSLSFVIVEEDSRNNRILGFAGATDVWTPQDFMSIESLCSDAQPDLVISVMEINTPTVEQVILTAGRSGIDVVLNAAPASHILYDCYEYITHLLVNESEAAILSGFELDENVVITLGDAGAFFANNEGRGHVPAFEVKPVDSTGAGDTFTGSSATEYLRQKKTGRGWDIKKAVTRSCMASALTICKIGAQEGIPWVDEVDEFASTYEARRVSAKISGLKIPSHGQHGLIPTIE